MSEIGVFSKFKKIFSRKLILVNGQAEYSYNGTLCENDIVGAIANRIAQSVGKLEPQVIRKDAKGTTIKNDKFAKLIGLRPCPEMSIYDFLYRIASDAVLYSNSYSIIFWNNEFTEIERIQPVSVTNAKIFEDENGNILFEFQWTFDRKTYIVPYQFVIHIKNRYKNKRFMGTNPDVDLHRSAELLDVSYEGIKNIVKNSASLRGYLKYNNFIDDDELKRKVQEFSQAYLTAENNYGMAGLDNTIDFHEINQQAKEIPTSQINFFRENIYRYYGVNEKILNSGYTETEWNSFYESVVEPIALQLSLEFTFKIFSDRERGFGNKIIFTTNRLQYASLQTRSAVAKDLFDRGVITINEYREFMYLPTIPDGDVRMISLNYVKTDDQTLYQTGKNMVRYYIESAKNS